MTGFPSLTLVPSTVACTLDEIKAVWFMSEEISSEVTQDLRPWRTDVPIDGLSKNSMAVIQNARKSFWVQDNRYVYSSVLLTSDWEWHRAGNLIMSLLQVMQKCMGKTSNLYQELLQDRESCRTLVEA